MAAAPKVEEQYMSARIALCLFVGAATALPAAPASAAAFAEFLPIDQPVLWWVNDGPRLNGRGGSLFTATGDRRRVAVDVAFRFLLPTMAEPGFIPAKFDLFGVTVDEPATRGPELSQVIQHGAFSLTNTSAFRLNGRDIAAGRNLLSATFVRSRFFWGGLTNDLDTSAVTFTSDFIDFSGVTESGYFLELTGQNVRALPDLAFESHSMSARGQFATLPAATVSNVPEPASWAMMIAGFGLVGATQRQRRRAAVTG
jgi:hypothetical protein